MQLANMITPHFVVAVAGAAADTCDVPNASTSTSVVVRILRDGGSAAFQMNILTYLDHADYFPLFNKILGAT